MMKNSICLTTAAPFTESAPGEEPAIESLDVRVLRNLSAGDLWPEDDASDVQAMFCSSPPPNFAAFPNLRWLQIESSGFAHLFPFKLGEKGIMVTNGRGLFDCPIAEWNIAMMVNLTRDGRQLIRNQDAAIWDRSAVFQREIRGLTLGLWGYGGIGRETARLARHMGLRVHVMTRRGVEPVRDVYSVPGTGDPEGILPDRVFTAGDEQAFLSELDFLVVAMPMTESTKGLIGERELRALPRTAFVLNPARGPIIEQKALLRALRESWIAGAALDTHYHYPMPPEHPLWHFPNVIFTPHISGSSLSTNYQKRLLEVFSINAGRFSRQEPFLNQISPEQLAGA